MEFHHVSVLLQETIEYLNINPDGVYVDCTLGGAGHSTQIVKHLSPKGRLIGIDQDQDAIRVAQDRLAPYADRVTLVNDNFHNLSQVLEDLQLEAVDGLVFDLGVSSYQLDTPERGFSYQHDAPLDMRMGQANPLTAYQVVNEWSEEELNDIIWKYGEERWAKRVAQFIVQERRNQPIETTGQLVEVIKKAIPAGARHDGPHPAKRTFQAIRIAVNNELDRFEEALKAGVEKLAPGGRVCIITFHSLEDRIAKQVLSSLSKSCICPPRLPICQCNGKRKVKVITTKPILPTSEELAANPRSRSAKLRVAQRV